MPRVVLLVPFSSEEQSRRLIWGHVNSWLKQTLDYPMYIGELGRTPGRSAVATYNASLARNHAAKLAGDWDVAVFHDADTIINPQQIKDGVAMAQETGAVVYPYSERWELDFDGTKMLLEDESSDWQSHLNLYTLTRPLGGSMIIRRDLWELVRGFDTGFVGWGHEDGAFAIACEVLSGKKLKRIAGKSMHLEHTLAPGKSKINKLYRNNLALINKYLQAMNMADTIDAVRSLRSHSISIDAKQGIIWPKH